MSNAAIAPIAQNHTNQCTITPPWFVRGSEYHALTGSFKALVNGEEAFQAVYDAIEQAQKTVSIICWGFQPSMHFIRDGVSLPIGALLEKKAEAGVKVRVLCYAFEPTFGPDFVQRYFNVTGYKKGLDESNTPGRHDLRIQDRPATSTPEQYQSDVRWYALYDDDQEIEDVARKKIKALFGDRKARNLHFVSRGFSGADRARIAGTDFTDKGLTFSSKTTLSSFPSHHQKMVLVDYEDKARCIGFVMGHNMLDEYWDTCAHSHRQYPPNRGRNGALPRQDLSARLTGPVVGDLFLNFAQAWEKEAGESLPKPNFAAYPPRANGDDRPVMAQILRTQPQYGVEDIKQCYLQAANNASRFIYIENQYFRWPPLAEQIKEAAQKQCQWGRDPAKDGSLYLFVVTNSSDSGMGSGVVNTYRMLDSLGRSDAIPGVARLEKADDLEAKLGQSRQEAALLRRRLPDLEFAWRQNPKSPVGKQYPAATEQLKAAEARQKALEQELARVQDKEQAVLPEERPGLKTHVCTLVAPDTPAGMPWMDVYVHAKLMIVDDTFMTLGSANINTRSMQTDSELNVAHHRPEITPGVRRRLWGMHTNSKGAQDEPAVAFEAWRKLMKENKSCQKRGDTPQASLIEFHRDSTERKNLD